MTCPDCDGEGDVLVINYGGREPYRDETCDTCNGTGEIEESQLTHSQWVRIFRGEE